MWAKTKQNDWFPIYNHRNWQIHSWNYESTFCFRYAYMSSLWLLSSLLSSLPAVYASFSVITIYFCYWISVIFSKHQSKWNGLRRMNEIHMRIFKNDENMIACDCVDDVIKLVIGVVFRMKYEKLKGIETHNILVISYDTYDAFIFFSMISSSKKIQKKWDDLGKNYLANNTYT